VDSLGLRSKTRYESHALLEVRTSRWNPFAIESAILIDISWEGFKIEFVGSVKPIKPESWLRLSIPLSPFGIMHPQVLKLDAHTKWFDDRNSRCGGVFFHASDDDKVLIAKIIEVVEHKRKAAK
jgi:hypothetical protein